MPSSGNRAAFDRLRGHGLRATPQRSAILTVLEREAPCHLSARDVLARARDELPEVSRATVYNTLREFVAAGLLRAVPAGRMRFYETRASRHEHFRCTACGRVFDVHVRGRDGVVVEEPGFAVATVLLEGTCPACVRSRQPGSQPP